MNTKKKDDLQEKLEEAQQQQDKKGITEDSSDDSKWWTPYQELEQRIIQLEKEKKELEEIAKRSQYDYINLKTDFDRYQRQIKESSQHMELDSLLSIVKKFLPFIEDLRKSLENITDEHTDDPLTKWVQMVYNKFLKTLEHLHIKPIESIGLVPDSFLHEPVSVEPVEDETLKWKIIREFERGFVYDKGGDKRVIIASKVIVWQ
jgi:molecular chaperone GrpE